MSLIQSFTTRGGTTLANAAHVVTNLFRQKEEQENEILYEESKSTKIQKSTYSSDEVQFQLYVFKDDKSYDTVTHEDVYFESSEEGWEDKTFYVAYADLPAGDTLRDKAYAWLKTQAEFSSATDGLDPAVYTPA